jgi:carbamoyltransferase
MKILGISSFYHDSSATLLIDGEIIAAVQEERFSRIKHDKDFPKHSIKYCLKEANIELEDIDYFVFYDKPILKFERLLETYLAMAPKGLRSFLASAPVWIKEKIFQKKTLIDGLAQFAPQFDFTGKVLFNEHHQSHAASAFFPSPYEKAIILTMDGVGEWATTTVAIGNKNKIEMKKEIHFPHSLGLLYSAFTYHCGFKVNSGEYKLMGLAPYGKPRFVDKIKDNLIVIKEDGSFRLNMKYFDYCTDLKMTNKHFSKLFGLAPRQSESDMTQDYMDMAASIQKVTEEIIIKLIKSLVKEYNIKNICLAGGVALNSVANGKILKENIVDNLWIQPAAGDSGGSLGAALSVHYEFLSKEREINSSDSMKGAYLGPEYSNDSIREFLDRTGAIYIEQINQDELLANTVSLIKDGNCLGWFQGRMEYGPRALGNRSIIADPRSESMQKTLNLRVKNRESFRPFAPSVLEEKASQWFNLQTISPYMLLVTDVDKEKQIQISKEDQKLNGIALLQVKRSQAPAITHVDYSARVQTVSKNTNPLYHSLISKFDSETNCPVIINTSFNIRGEPIVESPQDAFRCFMGTGLDALVLGNYILLKKDQDPKLKEDYSHTLKLD